MQNVWAGVSGMNTDSRRLPSASDRTNFRVPSSDSADSTIRGVVRVEVGHGGGLADATLPDPPVDLSGVEPRMPLGLDEVFESPKLDVTQIE
jgi:hypothetical protein